MKFTQTKASVIKLSMILLAIVAVGCEPQTKPAGNNAASASDHGHEHPETLADGVKQLEGICTTIKAAFAKDDAEAAHEPMHEIAHLLEQFPALITKSSLDEVGKAEVTKATDDLFQAFSAVDEGMHGGEGKKFADVAETIDASLKILSDKVKS